ncbi:gly-3 [Symbiodinium sp. CCMP2592]|nr:gly-3 [Symbiodinium sp. CCMP2592]
MADMFRRCALAAGLALTTGWADVICVTEYSCFVGMLTGNLIKMGSGVAKHGYADALFYISVILCNLGGVCFMRALQLHMPKRAAAIAAPVYLMLIFLSDVLTWHYGHSKWHACLVAPAYGGQNVLGLEGTLKVSTTTTTGNFQKLSVGLFSLLTDGPATLSESQKSSLVIAAIVPLWTLIGALVGGFTVEYLTTPERQWRFRFVAPVQFLILVLHDFLLNPPACGRPSEPELETSSSDGESTPPNDSSPKSGPGVGRLVTSARTF